MAYWAVGTCGSLVRHGKVVYHPGVKIASVRHVLIQATKNHILIECNHLHNTLLSLDRGTQSITSDDSPSLSGPNRSKQAFLARSASQPHLGLVYLNLRRAGGRRPGCKTDSIAFLAEIETLRGGRKKGDSRGWSLSLIKLKMWGLRA